MLPLSTKMSPWALGCWGYDVLVSCSVVGISSSSLVSLVCWLLSTGTDGRKRGGTSDVHGIDAVDAPE